MIFTFVDSVLSRIGVGLVQSSRFALFADEMVEIKTAKTAHNFTLFETMLKIELKFFGLKLIFIYFYQSQDEMKLFA